MSILPGTLIDLQAFELRLIRSVLCDEPMWPPPTTPGGGGFDEGEMAIIELNYTKANDLYKKYKKAKKRLSAEGKTS